MQKTTSVTNSAWDLLDITRLFSAAFADSEVVVADLGVEDSGVSGVKSEHSSSRTQSEFLQFVELTKTNPEKL